MQQTVLFLDLLGFRVLTLDHPDPFLTLGPDKDGASVRRYSPSHSVFSRFHGTLEYHLQDLSRSGDISAMVFSDCAFIVAGTALSTAMTAVGLMRSFMFQQVPVRMGIGYVTYNPVRFTSDTYGSSTIHRSLFSGSAVVTAVEAESEAKGLRVLLHRDAMAERSMIEMNVPVIPRHEASGADAFELDFLFSDDENGSTPGQTRDEDLMRSVWAIRENAPDTPQVQQHYENTITAINAMRRSRGRPDCFSM